jgi:hypothetical protein
MLQVQAPKRTFLSVGFKRKCEQNILDVAEDNTRVIYDYTRTSRPLLLSSTTALQAPRKLLSIASTAFQAICVCSGDNGSVGSGKEFDNKTPNA